MATEKFKAQYRQHDDYEAVNLPTSGREKEGIERIKKKAALFTGTFSSRVIDGRSKREEFAYLWHLLTGENNLTFRRIRPEVLAELGSASLDTLIATLKSGLKTPQRRQEFEELIEEAGKYRSLTQPAEQAVVDQADAFPLAQSQETNNFIPAATYRAERSLADSQRQKEELQVRRMFADQVEFLVKANKFGMAYKRTEDSDGQIKFVIFNRLGKEEASLKLVLRPKGSTENSKGVESIEFELVPSYRNKGTSQALYITDLRSERIESFIESCLQAVGEATNSKSFEARAGA